MKKRMLGLFLVSVMVIGMLSLFASCKPGNATPTDDSETGPGGKQKLTLLYPWNSFLKSTDEVIDPESGFFDERWKMIMDKVNISIEYVSADFSTMADKIRVMIGAGDLTDMALAFNMDPREYRKYAEEGGIKLLSKDLISKYPNVKRNLDSITAIESFIHNDSYVAIPRSMDLNGISGDYTYMLIYRKDIATSAGIELKDAYTVEEMYDMFTKVKAKYPDMQIASHIWPTQMLQFGLYQYNPYLSSTPIRNFYFDPETNRYEYAPANPDTIKGILWFKKFYDAGFINSDYVNLQNYEASTYFSGGNLFCYFNGANASFLDSIKKSFYFSNLDLSKDCVDTFLLKDHKGRYMIRDDGNYAGEFIFNPKISDEKLDAALKVLDYLMSDEGIDLAFYGIEGKHYKVENGELVNIRKVLDAKKEIYEPFGGVDSIPCVIQALVPEVSIAFKNPYIDKASKDRIKHLFDLRTKENHLVYKYDSRFMMYNSKVVEQFELDALAEINKLIIREDSKNIEAKWKKWLQDNKSEYQKVLDDLNSNLLK